MQLVSKIHPALKTICEPVTKGEDISALIEGMFKIMRQNYGVGLAAPQIGITSRVVVVEWASTSTAIINPVITKTPGKVIKSIGEGCLSFPGKRVDVKRSKRVIVEGFNENWEPIKIDARNFLAFVMQHEIDHLNGITIA